MHHVGDGIDTATGVGRDRVRGANWGPYEHMPPSQWKDDQNLSESYRRCCTSVGWVAQALALRLMHAEPGHPWTVPELASAVSMSRSAFAGRFKELVGTTPLDHLTEWRMVRAAGMMRQRRHLKLAAVADAVGYESESAFGKVFRRVMGLSPGQYRRELATATAESTSLNGERL